MNGQIEASQLTRRAFVYVRQSSMAQVLHHHESTMMQYDLRQRAIALGWAPEAIEVIDEDQARSGTTTDGRSGFARLAGAVAHGEAGGVFAIDVSRMARASEDWRRLLVLCGVAGVVVVDAQRIYDPTDQDDKLLLDLKGTMSEVEIPWLRLRLQGARQHKARRGALRMPAPTGYLWGERGFELDPDEAVQRAVGMVFQRYDIEPSAWAVVRWARHTGFTCPTRRPSADGDGGVAWNPLRVSRLHEMLKNPVYAGVYAYGRRRERKVLVDGQIRRVRPDTRDPERWVVKIEGAHPGYITWERYVQNQEKLRQNMTRMGNPSRGAPREGPALPRHPPPRPALRRCPARTGVWPRRDRRRPLLPPRRLHPQTWPRSARPGRGLGPTPACSRPRTPARPGLLPLKGDAMLREPTVEKLQALKLQAMAQAWTDQQQTAELTSLAFDERFALLVEAEWLARENKRLGRALREAKLTLSHACLEAIDYPARRELDKAVIRQLATGRWVHEHQNVLVIGATGVGKSFLACALAHQACRQGYRAYYRRVSRLFQTSPWPGPMAPTFACSSSSRASSPRPR